MPHIEDEMEELKQEMHAGKIRLSTLVEAKRRVKQHEKFQSDAENEDAAVRKRQS